MYKTDNEHILNQWLKNNKVINKDLIQEEEIKNEYILNNYNNIVPDKILNVRYKKLIEAERQIEIFITNSYYEKNTKIIKIIHGKGKNSISFIKVSLIKWIENNKEYIAKYCNANNEFGGSGCTVILLNK